MPGTRHRHESDKAPSGTYELQGAQSPVEDKHEQTITVQAGGAIEGSTSSENQKSTDCFCLVRVDFREGMPEEVRIKKSEKVRSGCFKQSDLNRHRPRGMKQKGVSREMQAVLYGFFRGEESRVDMGPAQGELLLIESR